MQRIPRGYSLHIEFVVEDCLDYPSVVVRFEEESEARKYVTEQIAKFQEDAPAHLLVTVKEHDLGQWEFSVAVPDAPLETLAIYLYKRTYLVDDHGGRERVGNGVYAD